MQCDMCGKETDVLYKTEIEGAVMYVCKECSRFGKVLGVKRSFVEKKKVKGNDRKKNNNVEPEVDIIEEIVDDYNIIVKNAREKIGLKQEDLAKKISEKVSLIQKIETGDIEPSIKVARKLEKFLKIKLIETIRLEKTKPKTTKESGNLTIGDIIEVKKK